jgi:hypothetical protein
MSAEEELMRKRLWRFGTLAHQSSDASTLWHFDIWEILTIEYEYLMEDDLLE